MNLEIRIATPTDADAWNTFVRERPMTHHAFAWEWRDILHASFGHEPRYLVAVENAIVVGVVPLFLVKSILFGRALVSVPYLNAGGILTDRHNVASALAQRLEEEASRERVKYVELRHQESSAAHLPSWAERSHKVSMILSLAPSSDEMMKRFSSKLRSQIRRPEKEGATSRIEIDSSSGVDDFYRVFAENMRDLGTPVYPKELFRRTIQAFGSRCRTSIVSIAGEPAAAGITITQGHGAEIPWASSLRRFNNVSPNMLLYWSAIRAGCEAGEQYFDFGRSSPDSGTYRFKAQWGAEPKALHWYYHAAPENIPDVNPKSAKFAFAVKVWQRLPLPIANLAGPVLTKSLP